MKNDDRIIVFDPKPNSTPDEVMGVLRMFVFSTYPPELRTRENMLAMFDALPSTAQRHFKIQHANA